MEYKDSFMQQCLSRSVETNYNDFKSFVDSVMDACIPTKMTSSRRNMPWFNNTLKKCQIMSITRGKSHPTHLYTLCGHVLSSVQEAKYLGITLTDELSWSSHVCSIHNRANPTLGFLRRNLRRCRAKLKETAYISR